MSLEGSVLEKLGIIDAIRFAFPYATAPEKFEEQTDILIIRREKTAYMIVNCYVDVCFVALLEGRPQPTAADVAGLVFEDPDRVVATLSQFARALGEGHG